MEKSIKTRIATGAAIATIAVASIFGTATNAYAETKSNYKQGTFVTMTSELTGKDFTIYIVKQGDNTSRISEKICRHFGVEPTTKYWPVIAFMNGFPRILQPGDIIFFPETLEEMEERLAQCKKSGQFARYVQKYNIYGKDPYDMLNPLTIGELLDDIYHNYWGLDVCIDQDFLNQYLNEVGVNGQYSLDTLIDNLDLYVGLTIYIPSLEQLGMQEAEPVKGK